MDKIYRNVVRCFLIKDGKVVAIRYKRGLREGFYDTPGGKVEENESIYETAIREFKEETGLEIFNPKFKGVMNLEYMDKVFIISNFIITECSGELCDFEENSSEWIDIEELLKKEKILSNTILLDRFFIDSLLNENIKFEINILVGKGEKIIKLDYKLMEE